MIDSEWFSALNNQNASLRLRAIFNPSMGSLVIETVLTAPPAPIWTSDVVLYFIAFGLRY